jgi:tetratricopeptide (TPR) repeat protein
MKKVVFLGNCQARRLEILYNESFSPITGDTTEFVGSYDPLTPRVRQILAEADVIAAQAIDSDHEIGIGKIESNAKIIEFPNITGVFLWPSSGQARVNNVPLPNMPDGPYGLQFGNRWLDKKIKAGERPEDIVGEYLSLDVAKTINLSRMYDLVMDRAHRRDEKTGFRIASIIETSLTELPLFLTPANLELPLFRPLAAGVYERLGIPTVAVNAMLDTLWRTPFPITDHPIHPSVARHFGLKFIGPETRYRTFTGERLTFAEWIERYVRYEWNDTLLEGAYKGGRIRRFDEEAQAALDQIEAGLAVGSGSAYGESCRAHLLKLKGDHAGALAATYHAAELDPANPQIVGTLALYRAEEGNCDEAERIAEYLTTRWPNYADGWNRLGIVLTRAGKLSDAVGAVEKAIAIEPRKAEFHKHIVSLLARSGQIDRAIRLLWRAIALIPDQQDLYLELSCLCAQAGDLDAALISAREAVELDSANAPLHAHLGDILARRNDLVGAINALREATRIAPENPDFARGLAHILGQIGQNEAPRIQTPPSISSGPADVHLRHVLAQDLVRRGELKEAEAVLVEALTIDPAHEGLHTSLIKVLTRSARVDEAEAAARRAVKINPLRGFLHLMLADTLQTTDKLREAEISYRTAVALAPDQVDWRGSLALVVNRQGRLDESFLIIEEAVRLAPENPHLLAKKCFLLMEKGDLAQAKSVIEAAIAIAPQLAGLQGTLAALYEREGNLSGAIEAYRVAIHLDSSNAHYRRQVERLTALDSTSPQAHAAE